MNAITNISAITEITDRLASLLASENEVLTHRRPRDLAATLPEKETLTASYEQGMLELRNNPELLERLAEEDMLRLRKATNRFQDALDDHRRLVQATKSVTERMIRSITDEVAKRNEPTKGYNDQAVVDSAFPNPKKKAVSLAFDQII